MSPEDPMTVCGACVPPGFYKLKTARQTSKEVEYANQIHEDIGLLIAKAERSAKKCYGESEDLESINQLSQRKSGLYNVAVTNVYS